MREERVSVGVPGKQAMSEGRHFDSEEGSHRAVLSEDRNRSGDVLPSLQFLRRGWRTVARSDDAGLLLSRLECGKKWARG
jgi:hypothetical protein